MQSLIFDLNGTMIDDMDYHTRGWLYLLNNVLGGNFTWEQVKPQMYGKNQEVLLRLFGAGKFTEAEMDNLSLEKEQRYQEEFLPNLKLISGLREFLEKAYQMGVLMAIGSAAIPFNIDFVLDNLGIRHYFSAIVSADDVLQSKPHPETFLKAAGLLNVPPKDCLVFEDVPKGVESAQNAGMRAIVLTTTHQPAAFAHLNNVLHFTPDFRDPYLYDVLSGISRKQ